MIWLLLGLVAVLPLLYFAHRLPQPSATRLLGRGLIIAALVYLIFAMLWGDTVWFGIESMGIFFYGLFYWLALRHSPLWLAGGWLLHPVWDVALHLQGPGAHIAPTWYATACISFDFAVAGYWAYRIQNLESG